MEIVKLYKHRLNWAKHTIENYGIHLQEVFKLNDTEVRNLNLYLDSIIIYDGSGGDFVSNNTKYIFETLKEMNQYFIDEKQKLRLKKLKRIEDESN